MQKVIFVSLTIVFERIDIRNFDSVEVVGCNSY